MELTWDKGYMDYEDPAWEKRMQILKDVQNSTSAASAQGMDGESLLNYLEKTEELLRYYAAERDFQNLENLMRKYEPLLPIAAKKKSDHPGYWYLQMEYERLNAILYMDQGSYRYAADHYEKAHKAGEECFTLTRDSESQFQTEQNAYLIWSYAELLNEMALAYERMMAPEKQFRSFKDAVPVLNELKLYIHDAPGIQEKAAMMYGRIGATCFQQNDLVGGMDGYRSASAMFDSLAKERDSDYYAAMSIWETSMQAGAIINCTGQDKKAKECEAQIEQFIRTRGIRPVSRAIADGSRAMIQIYKAIQEQRSGNPDRALGLLNGATAQFGETMKILEKEIDQGDFSIRTALTPVAAGFFTGHLTALETFGLLSYHLKQTDKAETALKATLELRENDRYSIAEAMSVMLQAESCQYLALIYTEKNDGDQMVYYAREALDLCEDASKKMANVSFMQIGISAASLLEEYGGFCKDKAMMKEYANRGLALCDMLAQAEPANDLLSMRKHLEKCARKAEKRFSLFG